MDSTCEILQVDGLDVVIWLNGAKDPPANEWSEACRSIVAYAKAGNRSFSTFREIVVTDGGTPNSAQRKEHHEDTFLGQPLRVAAVTTVLRANPLKRGVATAVSWMNPNFQVFEPQDILLALDHLGIGHGRFDIIWSCFQSMQTRMPPNRTLRQVGAEFESRCAAGIARLVVGGLLERPRTSHRAPALASSLTPSRERYGRYEVVHRLASGGTAEVFEARHIELGTRVAIKLLQGKTAGDDRAIRRVLGEGRAAAAIRHPHVVTVVDVGVQSQVPYLVMDLLEGEDLAQWLSRRAALTVEESVGLLLPVLSGLCSVHSAGLVHRDLKPSNIFLAQRQGGVDPVIIDFGISKFVDPTVPGATSTGVVGTPQYMAPEQVRGLRATPATDQYALGAVLYECVTGGSPFVGEDRYELFHAIVTAPIVAPSEVNSDVPSGFDEVVLRAMARDPAGRFPSVAAFGAALIGFASAEARRDWGADFAGTEGESTGTTRASSLLSFRRSSGADRLWSVENHGEPGGLEGDGPRPALPKDRTLGHRKA